MPPPPEPLVEVVRAARRKATVQAGEGGLQFGSAGMCTTLLQPVAVVEAATRPVVLEAMVAERKARMPCAARDRTIQITTPRGTVGRRVAVAAVATKMSTPITNAAILGPSTKAEMATQIG